MPPPNHSEKYTQAQRDALLAKAMDSPLDFYNAFDTLTPSQQRKYLFSLASDPSIARIMRAVAKEDT